MPLISGSAYQRRPWYLPNGHLETIIPSMFFQVETERYARQRLELSDGDFLDLDWIVGGNDRCMVITHGLEGSSTRHYVKRTAHYFADRGWDVLAWNCRSCSGEMNRKARFYHHGDTTDLRAVIQSITEAYQKIFLVGYSMGGSMNLKYLGESKAQLDGRIIGSANFSVPCHLENSAEQLRLKSNRIYERKFVEKLLAKIRIKAEQHPEIDPQEISQVQTFDDFHQYFTAPLHGFANVAQFFKEASCLPYLSCINLPSLIVNAVNDPLLGDACYPRDLAASSDSVYLEIPQLGGHVGFTLRGKTHSYMETRTAEFLKSLL